MLFVVIARIRLILISVHVTSSVGGPLTYQPKLTVRLALSEQGVMASAFRFAVNRKSISETVHGKKKKKKSCFREGERGSRTSSLRD